ncbi:MAG: hypothetical protein ACK4HV_03605 [Parachlamydiaceae bacterium]
MPKLFLSVDEAKVSKPHVDLYLKRNLFFRHESKVGIWVDHPIDLDALKLKIAFLESLLKKISSDYNKALNPIKLNIYFESN